MKYKTIEGGGGMDGRRRERVLGFDKALIV